MNPTRGQAIEIRLASQRATSFTVSILDRDGFRVRTSVPVVRLEGATSVHRWDGRDDTGSVVPDEAYSLHIRTTNSNGEPVYFPASEAERSLSVAAAVYDRVRGVLSYSLPWPGRVHVQTGSARIDERTKQPVGPVLKTLVNREPRPSGSVVEHWNGYDESGTVHVPSLPDFRVAVYATSLPENAIICVGNDRRKFLDVVRQRQDRSLLPTKTPTAHSHHLGLTAMQDVAPKLVIRPLNAVQEKAGGRWRVRSSSLRFELLLEGPSAQAFAQQPGKIVVFRGSRLIREQPASLPPVEMEVRLPARSGAQDLLTVNWASDWGPAAVNSLPLR